jgi:putative DNA primase/helicase
MQKTVDKQSQRLILCETPPGISGGVLCFIGRLNFQAPGAFGTETKIAPAEATAWREREITVTNAIKNAPNAHLNGAQLNGHNNGRTHTVEELAQAHGMKRISGEWHGPHPTGDGATSDGFILNDDGTAWDRPTNQRYTSPQTAELFGIHPNEFAPVREYRERNGHQATADTRPAIGPAGHQAQAKPKRDRTTISDYHDATGKVLFQAERREYGNGTKDFLLRRPDGRGGWVYSISAGHFEPFGNRWEKVKKCDEPSITAVYFDAVETVLYQLPKVLKAQIIFVVEGEKCADRLNAELSKAGLLGEYVATTNPLGAGKWRDSYSKVLAGKQIIFVPDNDEPGEKHQAKACPSIAQHAATLKVLRLPGLPKKGDVYDFLNGHTIEEVLSLADQAPAWEAAAEPPGQASNARPVLGFAPTDTGNGERFAAQHGGDVKYTAGLGWLHYSAGRWIPDRTGETQRRAKATAISINIEAGHASDDGHRKQLRDWAGKSESMAKRDAMIRAAQSEPEIAALAEQFDANKWLFNVANGTLNLSTGQLHPHRRGDYITKISPVAFDPQAKCPRFRAFLSAIMGNDAALVEFVQRAVGYSLTGDTREQCFFVLHGNGSNGKSTLLDTLRELLGDYGMQTKPDTLLARREEGINNDVARLRGARFVTAVETGEGKRLAESKIKEMTGGDYITARFLFKENFDFKPEFKIFLATNHKPEIKGTDDGIWRRVRLIPFNVRFWNAERGESGPPELKANNLLLEQLRAELPGILAWAVEGCLKWQRDGLTAPSAVLAATNQYREEQDVLGVFLNDCCTIGPECRATVKAIKEAYEKWCEANGEKPVSKIALSKKLQERGFAPFKRDTIRGWRGVGIVAEEEKS